MRILVVFNHPYEKSYCSAILASVQKGLERAGHELDLIHLDRDEFDPVMRSRDLKAFVLARTDPEGADALLDEQVRDYKIRIQQADHIVFIFPIWWELMPAIMKGFIDKLIFPGIVYDYNDSGTRMHCRLENLSGVTMITTMNTPSFAYRLIFGNAVKKALLTGTFWKIGVKNREWFNLSGVKFASNQKRQKWLSKIERKMYSLK